MAVNIKLKHSSVDGKAPIAADASEGELLLNINANSPAAYIKDSDGNIVKLAGAGSVTDATNVKKAGDNMTGDLTLGTDKITLDADTGSAGFGGDVRVRNYLQGNPNSNKLYVQDTVALSPDREIEFSDVNVKIARESSSAQQLNFDILSSTVASVGSSRVVVGNNKIALNTSGSAEFAGVIVGKGIGPAYAFEITDGTTNMGGLYRDSSGANLYLKNSAGVTNTFLFSDGSAEFKGDVAIGDSATAFNLLSDVVAALSDEIKATFASNIATWNQASAYVDAPTTLPADTPTPLRDAVVRATTAGKINLNSNGSISAAGSITAAGTFESKVPVNTYAFQITNGTTNFGGLYNTSAGGHLYLKDGAGDTKISLYGNDGSITAAGAIYVSELNSNSDTTSGSLIGAGGSIYLQREASADVTDETIRSYHGTDLNFTVDAGGSITAAGKLTINAPTNNEGAEIYSDGRLFQRVDNIASNTPVYGVYSGGYDQAAATVQFFKDGSGEFAGACGFAGAVAGKAFETNESASITQTGRYIVRNDANDFNVFEVYKGSSSNVTLSLTSDGRIETVDSVRIGNFNDTGASSGIVNAGDGDIYISNTGSGGTLNTEDTAIRSFNPSGLNFVLASDGTHYIGEDLENKGLTNANITLKANGSLDVGGTGIKDFYRDVDDSNANNNFSLFRIFGNPVGSTKTQVGAWSANGSIGIGGNAAKIEESNIALYAADGSAAFKGDIKVGGYAPRVSNLEGVMIYAQGSVFANRTSGGGNVFNGNLNDVQTSSILADGSATFVGTVTATVVPPSDARFKENITPAKPQLADVVALGGLLKNYDWNDQAPLNEEIRSQRQLGLIAQEAAEVCPAIVKDIHRTKQGAVITPEETIPAVYEDKVIPAEYETVVTPAKLGPKGKEIVPASTEEVLVTPERTEQVLVTPEKVIPATYEELDDSYKGISQDALIMKLIGAVTELSAEVAALKAIKTTKK